MVQKLLVISSLALPFNYCFGAEVENTSAKNHKLNSSKADTNSTQVVNLIQDQGILNQALFRLSGQAFFLTDLKLLQSSFQVLDCLSDKSLVEVFIGESRKELLIKASKDRPKWLHPYILFEKLKLVSLNTGNDSLSAQELKTLSKRCSKYSWDKLSKEQRAVLISETYLRDRFLQENEVDKKIDDFQKSIDNQEVHEVFIQTLPSQFNKLTKKHIQQLKFEGLKASEIPTDNESSRKKR